MTYFSSFSSTNPPPSGPAEATRRSRSLRQRLPQRRPRLLWGPHQAQKVLHEGHTHRNAPLRAAVLHRVGRADHEGQLADHVHAGYEKNILLTVQMTDVVCQHMWGI